MESILITGLATFGMTYLICFTDGPFNIFKRLRMLAGVEYFMMQGEEVWRPPTKFFAKLLVCHWCTGTWVSIIMSIAYVVIFKINPLMLIYLIPCGLGISGFLCEKVVSNG
jgi:hypothetical protein